MKVCIAEKPSVAREIAKVLGANTRRDGYFEGNGYAVTYTFGHLCTLWEPNDYKPHWKRWDLNSLPMLPEKFKIKLNSNAGIKKQFEIIKKLFDQAELVINCGDAGQEGELIQRWVVQEADYQGQMKRLWISSLTEEAIKEGFDNLRPSVAYDSLFYAGFSRAIGDWLLGMNATRLYTLKYARDGQVLSVGRVQTPTLAMVVERYLSILNFKPVPYWELQTVYRDTLFRYEEGRFLDKDQGLEFAEETKQHDFEITRIDKKNGKEYAPKLFDLTSLQVYCNSKFGYTAEETLNIAQKLYEQKLITYPRVDTSFLPNDLFPKIPGILSKLSKYNALIAPLLSKKLKKSAKVFNDKKVTDHHAIIPTGIEMNLSDLQQRVYDVICRRFIASFYDDCKVANTSVQGKAGEILFKTSGKLITSPGWRVVFENKKPDQDKDKSVLPVFKLGEKGPHEPSFLEKETKPPNQFTEGSLLRSMESAGKDIDDEEMREVMKENGIGRPSTRASIIETLFRRNYIIRNKKQILPTATGINLIEIIQNSLLKSAELTGMWEKKLKEIEKGEYHAAHFINQMKSMVDHLVYEVRSEKSGRFISMNAPSDQQTKSTKQPTKPSIQDGPCPKCKEGNLIKGGKAYGCSRYKEGCDFVLPFVFMGKKIPEKQHIKLLSTKKSNLLKGFKQGDQTLQGNLFFDDTFKLHLKEKVQSKNTNASELKRCPKCKKGMILKGKKAYGCSNHAMGCDYLFPFDLVRQIAEEKPLTEKLVFSILNDPRFFDQ